MQFRVFVYLLCLPFACFPFIFWTRDPLLIGEPVVNETTLMSYSPYGVPLALAVSAL
jgi:hypothetical protein